MPQDRLTVIALTGRSGSGKDSVAAALACHAGFEPLALADGIREALNSLDGRTWGYRKERGKAGFTDRWAMQTMGTECREDLGCRYLWMELAAVKIWYASRYHPTPHLKFAIPDLRYQAEDHYLGDVVKLMGGHYELWRVSRVDREEIAEAAHSSERECDSIPCTRWLWNDGTLADLGARALANLNKIPGMGIDAIRAGEAG